MCGIAGYIDTTGVKAEIVKAMTDRIAHRGPDGEGFFVGPTCALGHRRLRIVDLETGDQPIYNEDGSLTVVFNGEIYNYRELRKELSAAGHRFATKSDTEVLVHGFEEWGTDITAHLRGMYAFAVWNENMQTLFLARDKWGIKPLYYYPTPNGLLFASEIKAFLDHPLFQKELNEEILAAYLCFNSVPTEESFFKGVFRVEPGHQMLWHDGQLQIQEYFHLDLAESETGESEDVWVEKIRAAMEDSVQAHGFADVEIGGFLSSGIDSSYLVSLAKPQKTFTVGYDNPQYDEITYAKDLASQLGIQNYARKITKAEYMQSFPQIMYYMDEPLADPSAIALYFVAKEAASHVKVVTSGEGADELFGGYLSYREEIDQAGYQKIPFFLRRAASAIAELLPEFPGRNFIYRRGRKLEDVYIGLGRVFSDKEAKAIVKQKRQRGTKEITAPFFAKCRQAPSMVKRQTIDYYFWLVRDFLHAVDRNTMMFGLEARTPFLDDVVYDAARTLPKHGKINAETTKPYLRKAAQSVIPNEAYKKKKLGFPVPLRAWMKEEDLFADIQTKFNSKAAQQFFDIVKINKLLTRFQNEKEDSYKKIWTIYTFLVWYHCYFEEET